MTSGFEAPGPGQWAIDRSHYPSGVTPISQALLAKGIYDGIQRVFKELGMPAESISAKFVQGFMYTRLIPLVGADSKPRPPPPTLILKAVSRLHPEFRARQKAAVDSLRTTPSNDVVKRWEAELRPGLIASNQAFQAFDPDAASTTELQAHITDLLASLEKSFELHFWLHGHDLGPIARYLHRALEWNLDAGEAIAALAGASPSTAHPIAMLCRLREMVDASEQPVGDLDAVRSISAEANALLDAYLDERGWILATGYDLNDRALGEMPEVLLTSIKTATAPPIHDYGATIASLRERVPASDQPSFDRLLTDARNVMDMRDDNGPLTIEWPVGLLRRALLAAGRRLKAQGEISEIEHIFEITPTEAQWLFVGAAPSDLAARAAERSRLAKLDAPTTLGPEELAPPLDALPREMGQLVAMTQTALEYLGMSPSAGSFSGAGVGTEPYVGTARVADSASDAIDRLEPGEVLVVRATSPAFNVVLGIAGAVVTADGGVLSHAAVLARELGLPAVIGVPDALAIPDGATVEVDPVAGLVRLI